MNRQQLLSATGWASWLQALWSLALACRWLNGIAWHELTGHSAAAEDAIPLKSTSQWS